MNAMCIIESKIIQSRSGMTQVAELRLLHTLPITDKLLVHCFTHDQKFAVKGKQYT